MGAVSRHLSLALVQPQRARARWVLVAAGSLCGTSADCPGLSKDVWLPSWSNCCCMGAKEQGAIVLAIAGRTGRRPAGRHMPVWATCWVYNMKVRWLGQGSVWRSEREGCRCCACGRVPVLVCLIEVERWARCGPFASPLYLYFCPGGVCDAQACDAQACVPGC